ncbi:hypothetical protein [Propionicimonas sp.]|uniref:hypothetical protein n=1 Tax=Propionicimonas sp. TaxID=1955623 RepID=UPI0039E53FF4
MSDSEHRTTSEERRGRERRTGPVEGPFVGSSASEEEGASPADVPRPRQTIAF